ncbi:ribonuclease Z [Aureibaculum sp. 2210JD6-5]|uniref:ribonuclease Z n=1 Tax=Aureibaculum sp. 2210JD6-5 TaxID=3103957 RepID=UPI002AACD85A|nr:ribonuclease Z [Aureibaculum sp. 2210JD6-5]MDY7393676.1 ribonuclease Z [Aureibaculum sp. 2210JD6-5]
MIIEKTDIATVFRNEKLAIDDFFSDFSKKYINFKNENIILDFSKTKGVDIENILLFLPIVEQHRSNGMSFVIILNEIEADKFPDEIIVVPTLVEAMDIVEMENIERDLGF